MRCVGAMCGCDVFFYVLEFVLFSFILFGLKNQTGEPKQTHPFNSVFPLSVIVKGDLMGAMCFSMFSILFYFILSKNQTGEHKQTHPFNGVFKLLKR